VERQAPPATSADIADEPAPAEAAVLEKWRRTMQLVATYPDPVCVYARVCASAGAHECWRAREPMRPVAGHNAGRARALLCPRMGCNAASQHTRTAPCMVVRLTATSFLTHCSTHPGNQHGLTPLAAGSRGRTHRTCRPIPRSAAGRLPGSVRPTTCVSFNMPTVSLLPLSAKLCR